MKLETPRDLFLTHLQAAASVCPTRSTRPILTDVLVSVEGQRVEITATDGEITVRRSYEHEGVSGEGQAALPAGTLLSAVRSMTSDTLSLEPQGGAHELTGGKAYFKLQGDDPELFPAVPEVNAERGLELPLGDFVGLCQRTMFAAAREMGRYAFNGVLLEVDPKELTLVATDGRRLSKAALAVDTGVTERFSVVVPLKGLQQLQRLGASDDTQLRIEFRQTLVAFSVPGTEVRALLVEGEFPDFRAVMPKEADVPSTVTVDRQELAGAIQRATITAGDEGPAVALSLSAGSLRVASRQEGLGESRSDLVVDYSGDDVEIRFNPLFLGEYLKTMPETQVTFRFKDRASAGLFSSQESSVYVVMPITS
ncbi:MAG: DNA polymerase III subunit beta [Planctomycetota bacterium]|nr:MAG: DNA polymerase III subunit beta [Planctomycetota bacterium]